MPTLRRELVDLRAVHVPDDPVFSQPPPRGPLRSPGETRAATSSKVLQEARSSAIFRSHSAWVIGFYSGAAALPERP